jgi:3',5'-cyclic AMP phosphodiesterase CpdA
MNNPLMKTLTPAILALIAATSCAFLASRAAAPTLLPALTPIQGTPALGTPTTPTSFTFIAGGDNRPPDDSDGQPPMFSTVISQLATQGAAFVIWSGDSVYGKLKDPSKDKDKDKIKAEYQTFESMIGGVKLPVLAVPGNHEMDTKDNVPDSTGSLVKYFEKYVGPQYGYFTYGNSAFIGLNTDDGLPSSGWGSADSSTYAGNVSPAQLAALGATLTSLAANASIAHIFVFMHRPIFATPGHSDDALGPPSGPLLQALLQSYSQFPNLSFVFAGHQHLFYANTATPYATTFTRTDPAVAPPLFLISGGAGACLAGSATPTTGGFYNFLVVKVDGAQVTVTVQNLGSTQIGC